MSIRSKISQTKTAVIEQNWMMIFLTLAIAAFTVLYVWQVSVAATYGFEMRDIENEIELIAQENSRMEMEVARLQSVDSVTRRLKMLGMVEAAEINYVSVTDSSVALK